MILRLPLPPSVNRIWRSGRGRVFRSKRYVAWTKAADAAVLTQKPLAAVEGRFRVHITLDERRRRSSDADNRIKPVLDYLQRVELIENDRLCDSVSAAWGKTMAGHCLVVVTQR